MKLQDISQAKDPDLRASFVTMQRAAELAKQIAIQTDTSIVTVQDGQIVHISAQELRNFDDTKSRQNLGTGETIEDISKKAMALRKK
ncbi:MAG: hypothetical protein Q8N30_18035 [Methylococcales bacterium]|nr:hypothetical protein [Methylococcales bacterium]